MFDEDELEEGVEAELEDWKRDCGESMLGFQLDFELSCELAVVVGVDDDDEDGPPPPSVAPFDNEEVEEDEGEFCKLLLLLLFWLGL